MTSLFRLIIVLLLAFINSVSTCRGQVFDSSLSVYFRTNSSVIDRESKRQITQWLANNKPPIQFNLKGFTDTTGSVTYNQTLSLARAYAVANIIKNIFSDYALTVQGFGEDSIFDRSILRQNRKVIIEIAPSSKLFVPIEIDKVDSSNNKKDSKLKGAETIINKALENIYFVPDKPVLEEVSFSYLHDLASALLQYPPTTTFEIIGHVHCAGKRCNDPGLKKINDELSTARAKEVYLHLADMGIVAKRLSYRGVGSQNLAYSHPTTEEEARKNMRVEVIVHW